jgi:fumarate hydratase class II
MEAIVACIFIGAALAGNRHSSHYAVDNDLTLTAAALKLGSVTEAEFDRVVDPRKMVRPYVRTASAT